jgi:hypothetical protein
MNRIHHPHGAHLVRRLGVQFGRIPFLVVRDKGGIVDYIISQDTISGWRGGETGPGDSPFSTTVSEGVVYMIEVF